MTKKNDDDKAKIEEEAAKTTAKATDDKAKDTAKDDSAKKTDAKATDAKATDAKATDAKATGAKATGAKKADDAATEEEEEIINPLPFLEGCHAFANTKLIGPGTYPTLAAKVARLIIAYQRDGKAHHSASNDSGRTWCEPDSFENAVDKPLKDCRFSDAAAVHILEDLTAVAVCGDGVFYSKAAGALWRHMPAAGAGDTVEGPVMIPGSSMFEHPNFGLVLAGHVADGDSGKLRLRTSENKGESWFDFHQDLPKGMELVHPSILSLRGAFFMLAPNLGGKRGKKWHYAELCATHGRLPFTAAESTLYTADPTGKLGAQAMDVPALTWNEERQRIEAVITTRDADPEDVPEGTAVSLHLWSVSPQDWLAGTPKWQHDGCLVAVPDAKDCPDDGFAPSLAIGGATRHVVFHVNIEDGPVLCHMSLPSNFGV